MPRSSIAFGTLLALASAVLFGATTPAVQWFGRGVGPFTTAALLYAGAAALAVLVRQREENEPPLRRAHLPRLFAIALVGAALSPGALAWGLQRTSGTAASLLLNLEALFTIGLGVLFYREHVGRRVAVAALIMTAGGALLLVGRGSVGGAELWGLCAVAAATAGWALDNALARPLADLDPGAVVSGKGALGAAISFALALTLREPWPVGSGKLAALFACGAVGYGISLRLYLLAQRRLGAGRTASVFAVAPFVGAFGAWLGGQPSGGMVSVGAGALMALGAYLHLTEQHGHAHHHEAIEHEHAHRHDDGHHHDHAHAPMPEGAHSHWHRHEPGDHTHPHGPDAHHQHPHRAGCISPSS